MSGVVRGLVCAGLIASSGVVHAQGAATKPAPKPQHTKLGKPASAAPAPSAAAAAVTPPESGTPSAPTSKDADTAKPSEAAPPSDTPSSPSAPNLPSTPAAPPMVRVYMRSGTEPLTFSARAKNSDGTPTACSAPCDAKFLPGDYQLRLNGVAVEGPVKLVNPGTLQGKFESRESGREGGWLALNVGGILGGVFITVAALGGPSWTYIAGGGSLLSGGVIFVLTYRADRASVSFTPGEPIDVRGLPPPVPTQDNSSGPTHSAGDDRSRLGIGAQARGLGFRIAF